jgi:prolipoprotein diacylglyceryltransferase
VHWFGALLLLGVIVSVALVVRMVARFGSRRQWKRLAAFVMSALLVILVVLYLLLGVRAGRFL